MPNEQQTYLPNYHPTDLEIVRAMNLQDRVSRAIKLLKDNEPPEGYYLAFSGGKDSCVIKNLAKMSGVKFDSWYNQTTIDPPELVRFIKEHHKDTQWNIPKHGNMLARVVNRGMPTRFVRWCCEEYKEQGGQNRLCVFGVRAAESKARAIRWSEVTRTNGGFHAVCPIVYWADEHIWEFIRYYSVPYCSLYDEGWDRLGCVGCPLASKNIQRQEFDRWPAYERNWKTACRKNWEKYKDIPLKDGRPRYQARFDSWEKYWEWWVTEKTPDILREECQSGLLWTNQELDENEGA